MALGVKRTLQALGLAAVLTVGALSNAGSTPETMANEYDVKAAFLYNFARFIEWPPDSFHSPDAPFVIGVLGHDPFGSGVDNLVHGSTVHSHPLVFKRLAGVSGATECHVLFVSESESGHLKTILEALDDQPVLTVSDMADFVERGGMIGLDVEEQKVRFSVNKTVSDEKRLTISSQVLKLAKSVR